MIIFFFLNKKKKEEEIDLEDESKRLVNYN